MDAWEQMQNRVDAAIEEKWGDDKKVVIYSAYETDTNEDPIDNLHDIAFEGVYQILCKHDDFWDGRGVGIIGIPAEEQGGGEPCGKDFHSEPIVNPTWLDIAVQANKGILITNNLHHVFLEGAEVVCPSLGDLSPGIIELWFGS